ncbi:MAG: hypothetical protein AAF850_03180 [Pseudomonadota bacterium]
MNGAGESVLRGLGGDIIFTPTFPFWVIAFVTGVALLSGIVSAFRKPIPGAFRIGAACLLALVLLNPKIRIADETPLKDIALIIADRSQSQSLDGREGATDAIVESLQTKLAALGGVDAKVVDAPGTEETALVDAISTAIADTPRARLSAVFAVTDGQVTDIKNADTAFSGAPPAPIHVLTTGQKGERDRKISLVKAPRYGIVREKASVSFRIDDLGPDEEPLATGQSVLVSLRIDGQEVLSDRAPTGVDVTFDAPLTRPGPLIVELEVEPLEGELTTRNNIAVLPITAIRDRLRVLLISGEPHPGERVWRNLLKSDPAIDLVHFTILRPFNKGDGALQNELALIEFPRDELFIEKLSEFDLLIFDRYTYRGVLDAFHFDNIARYVENGGAVLVASGPEYNGAMSLAERRNLSFILPALPRDSAVDEPFRPAISKVGERHPVTAGLPEAGFWGRWLRIMPVTQKSGSTLMEGPGGAPLLVLDRYRKGRVGLILSDHVWLWARGFDGGGPHAELLRRVAHWLMQEPELEEESLQLEATGDDLLITRRSLADAPPPVSIVFPDGAERDLEMAGVDVGVFQAVIEAPPRGLYRARSEDLFAVGTVGVAAAPEFRDVVSHAARATALTKARGGGVFRVREEASVVNPIRMPAIRRIREKSDRKAGPGWAGLASRNAARVDAINERPLAPPAVWLALIAATLSAGWILEGRLFRGRNTP